MPSAAHPMVFLILFGAGSNARGKSRALEGAVSAPKAPQGSKTKKGELLEGLEKKIFLRQEIFFLSGTSKICLLKLVSLN